MAAHQGTGQKKEHKKFSRHLTRRVYHDRYFAYTVALLIFAGVALVGYVVIIGNRFSTDASFATVAAPNKIYTNLQQGYSVRYPSTWVLEPAEENIATVIFENPTNPQEGITVAPLSASDAQKLLVQLHAQNEAGYASPTGAQVKPLTVTTPSGASLDAALVSGSGKAFYVSGQSADFRTFVDNLKIIQ